MAKIEINKLDIEDNLRYRQRETQTIKSLLNNRNNINNEILNTLIQPDTYYKTTKINKNTK